MDWPYSTTHHIQSRRHSKSAIHASKCQQTTAYQDGLTSTLQSHHRNHPRSWQNKDSTRIHETQQSIQWGTITTTPQAHHMGPRHRTTPRSPIHHARPTTTPQPERNPGSTQLCPRTSEKGDDTRILEPICRQLLLHQKERQKTPTSTRLLSYQQMDQTQPERIPLDPTSNRPPMRLHAVHKSGRPMGL